MSITTFIPRDAGFFSVFNFYIGCLSSGMITYPFFNKQALLEMNHCNKHFCYWTKNENCWFDYLEPIQFYQNDTTHTENAYKTFPRHNGEIAPKEFRIPSETQALIKDEKRFKAWRHRVNDVYQKYIKFNKTINDNIDYFWNKNIKTNTNIIGIHYRHPSHFVESGKIYLEQYFDKIDKILLDHPNSQLFLATDSNFGIYAFQEKYNNKILYIPDLDRLSMAEFLHWCFGLIEGKADHVGFINGKGYELQHQRINNPDNKKLTTDLLTEILGLSKCNYLVHTTSNVSLAVSYMNPTMELISLS